MSNWNWSNHSMNCCVVYELFLHSILKQCKTENIWSCFITFIMNARDLINRNILVTVFLQSRKFPKGHKLVFKPVVPCTHLPDMLDTTFLPKSQILCPKEFKYTKSPIYHQWLTSVCKSSLHKFPHAAVWVSVCGSWLLKLLKLAIHTTAIYHWVSLASNSFYTNVLINTICDIAIKKPLFSMTVHHGVTIQSNFIAINSFYFTFLTVSQF